MLGQRVEGLGPLDAPHLEELDLETAPAQWRTLKGVAALGVALCQVSLQTQRRSPIATCECETTH